MRMRIYAGLVAALSLSAAAPKPTVESEVARAHALAGADFADSLFLCEPRNAKIADMLASGPPWLPPTRALDNLWYIGNAFVGAWVLKTSEGLILIDANQSEQEVRDHLEPGLKALGFEPSDIRYAIITHGHWDHYGGAKYLQERYGTRIGLSGPDWDLLARSKPNDIIRAPYFGSDQADRPPPKRDLVITDGQKLKLGDTEITLYVTPGHSPGTLSMLIPVREGGRTYILSLLGGTAFPPQLEPTDQTGGLLAFEHSVKRLSALSRKAGAVGLLNTHIFVDGTDKRLAQALVRKEGAPNPFVLGTDKVVRYYDLFQACLKAAELRPPGPAWSKSPPMPSPPDSQGSH
jgi:metallo-beta-lactamase class B